MPETGVVAPGAHRHPAVARLHFAGFTLLRYSPCGHFRRFTHVLAPRRPSRIHFPAPPSLGTVLLPALSRRPLQSLGSRVRPPASRVAGVTPVSPPLRPGLLFRLTGGLAPCCLCAFTGALACALRTNNPQRQRTSWGHSRVTVCPFRATHIHTPCAPMSCAQRTLRWLHIHSLSMRLMRIIRRC